MCVVSPSFHIPSLNNFFSFNGHITLSPENLPGEKACKKYCIEDKNGSNIKFIAFFPILIVIYLWEQRDATFYDNSVAATMVVCDWHFLYVMAITIESHRDATTNPDAARKLHFLTVTAPVHQHQPHSFPNKTKQKASKEHTHPTETAGRNKSVKNTNKCRSFKGKFYFKIQYLMQTPLPGIFFYRLTILTKLGKFLMSS